MKKSILSLAYILGLGISSVFGVDNNGQPEMDDRMGQMKDKMHRAMDGRGMHGRGMGMGMHPITNSQKMRFLKELGDYIDAYRYFKAVANAPRPTTKAVTNAANMAQRIVQRQDRFFNRLSQLAERLKRSDEHRELGEKIATRIMANQEAITAQANDDIIAANSGNKRDLWQDMRSYGHDIMRARKHMFHFLQRLQSKVEAIKEKIDIVMEQDQDGDIMENITESESNDVDQAD
ncbi:MAG: hypothetical protein C5B43_02620 [Verrucomicrobia bacterium]|nr:MAG: hypothetical protein C5B43_02620 [Verrucomicrobiota bacterium]